MAFGETDKNGKKWEDYDTIVCPDGQIIDMNKLLDDQQRAKAALSHLMPAIGGLVTRLRFVYTFQVETQATDGFNVFVNPQFTYNLDLTGKCFVMAHEIMHCLLNHMRRGKTHDQYRSNIAADYEVNITLVNMDLFSMGTIKKIGALVDKKYSGWGYEKIYDDNPAGPSNDNMSNSNQSNSASKNQQKNKTGSSESSNGSGGSGGQQGEQYSDDFKKGWEKAIEDYKKGKLKI